MMKFEGDIAGYPLRMPTIDVAAIAAGGGSLALIDEIGMIQVDRESAGSNPGPASYGRGGKRPTITDADLLLGRLSAVFDAENDLVLTPEFAKQAFETEICEPLGVDLDVAATSVLEIIQARMAKAIASNTVQKGIDIRSLPLFVYGGAGPVHGVELAEALNMNRVIVPHLASNFSALGLLLCPLRWDASEMVLRNASELPVADLAAIITRLENDLMEKAGRTTREPLETKWIAHMRYHGQSYDLIVEPDAPWTGELAGDMMPGLIDKFHQLHDRRYAYCSVEEEVEIVQLRVSIVGSEQDFPRPVLKDHGETAPSDKRQVYFTTSRARVEANIWSRAKLPPGSEISGPAVIEDQGSSILIPDGWTGSVDPWLNIDIRRG
jgi:N-methylhydantoinase A